MWTRIKAHFPTLLGTLPRIAASVPRFLFSVLKLSARTMTRKKPMIAIALACALICAETVGLWLTKRSKEFGQKAREYSWLERAMQDGIEQHKRWAGSLRKKAEGTSDQALAARFRQRSKEFAHDAIEFQRLVAYYGWMRQEYERAASYPWLLIEPDPPSPEP